MLQHTNGNTANDVDRKKQQAGNGVALHKLGRTVHGAVEIRFLGHFGAAFLGVFLADQAGVEVGVDGHLLAGHGVEAEAGRDFGDTSRALGDDDEIDDHQDGEDDDADDDKRILPPLSTGESCTKEKIDSEQHFTSPPPRYSEASLIKKMEELGIGRPSTYASVLATLQNRDYVILEKRRFTPDSKGRVVTSFLESFFKRYVEYDFTADLEERLDKISAGELQWKELLRDFWKQFSGSIDEIKDLRVTEVLDMLNVELAPLAFPPREDGSAPRSCPKCDNGELSLKVGRYGAFVGCSNYPDCNFTRQLGGNENDDAANDGPKVLGTDPDTEEEISLRTGRFGPYVQRGEGKEGKEGKGGKNLRLTQRPYTLEQLENVIRATRALKAANFPRSQLYQLAHYIREGLLMRSAVDYAYLVQRGKERSSSKAMFKLFDKEMIDLCNDNNWLPWRVLGEESLSEWDYDTPLLDIIELYPFIAGSQEGDEA